jgi:hypothetical protein
MDEASSSNVLHARKTEEPVKDTSGSGNLNSKVALSSPDPTFVNDGNLSISSNPPKSADEANPQQELDLSTEPPLERQLTADRPYSVFSSNQKRALVLTASAAAFFSPLSGAIYYPALPVIAKDLNVTSSQINLSVTTYLVSSCKFLSTKDLYEPKFDLLLDYPGSRSNDDSRVLG